LSKIAVWIKELRAPFMLLTTVSVSLGVAAAWRSGEFAAPEAGLTLLGVLLLHAGVNVLNDYFDYRSGIDLRTKRTPFSGGSGILPGKLLSPRAVYRAGLAFTAGGIIIGVFFVLTKGLPVLLFLVPAALCVYYYSTALAARGLGEFAAAFSFGPLAVGGSYYVQTMRIDLEPIVLGVAQGIMVGAILFLNELPDVEADRAGGRHHLPARLGVHRASRFFKLFPAAAYVVIIVSALAGLIPKTALLALATLPLEVKASIGAQRHFDDLERLVPAMGLNVAATLLLGSLLAAGYLVEGFFGPFS